MTTEEIKFQVALSCIQGVLEAKHGVLGEVLPSLAVKESLRIADEFVKQWLSETTGPNDKLTAWSEEDEKFFKTALWHISYSVSNGKTTDDHCDTTYWLKGIKERLKSPRPQSHWKPSEQEKGALRTAIHILTERNFPKAAAQLQNILNAFENEESRKEQSEMDLKKELRNLVKSNYNGCSGLDIARHFYELGRKAKEDK